MFESIVIAAIAVSLADAKQALEAGQYPQAITLYRQYLEQVDSKAYEALYGLARAQAFDGQWPAALETYNQLLTLFVDDPDALMGRGRLYSWMKRFDDAQKDFTQVMEKHPDYREAWSAMADLYRWEKRWPDLQSHWAAWEKKFPQLSEQSMSKARAFIDQRLFSLAREELIQARERGYSAPEISALLTQINRLPGALPWESLLLYEGQAFSADRPFWNTITGGIRYTFPKGTVALQGMASQRFGTWDQAAIVDTYVDLWSGGYGNLRLQAALNPQIIPRWDVMAELYQSFADTWEVSASYRLMQYNQNGVHFFSASLAKYLGNWYLRLHPMIFQSPDGPGLSLGMWARYFYDTADDYIELRSGVGRRVVTLGSGPIIEAQTNAYAILTAQRFVTPHIGILGTVNYNYDGNFPAQYGFSIGNKLRW